MKIKYKLGILVILGVFVLSFIGLYFIVISNLDTHASNDKSVIINDKYSLNKTSPKSVNLTDVKTSLFAIEPNIIEFNYDDKFIISRTESVQDKTTKKETIFYWIIDIEKEQLYGPMDEIEFIGKKRELFINLNLRKVSLFFK